MTVSEEGWKPLSPEEFAKRVDSGTFPIVAPSPVSHELEDALHAAQLEGLEANVRRQLAFVGTLPIAEYQALGVHRRAGDTFDFTKAAHARSIDEAVKLCVEAERFHCHGVYLMPAVLRSGVETRHSGPGSWFDIPQKGGTTDSDVKCRRILAIDFDVQRPSNTSATDEEMARSIHVALSAWNYLAGALVGSDAMAYLHSGNGRQIHLALDDLPNAEECTTLLASLLVGLGSLFDTDDVHVDQKLHDAKRILPACGTAKKKGAIGITERPHRRTAIVAPAAAQRLSLEAVKEVARKVWNDTDDAGRLAMKKAMGLKVGATSVTPITPNPGSPFDRANAVEPERVSHWLGLYDDHGNVRCPGCGETSGVAVLRRGLKCHHNRCQGKGRSGFRTNVDLVAEVQNLEPIEAARALGVQFGFETNFSTPAAPPISSSVTGPATFTPINTSSIQWISSADVFAPLPPIKWLVPELHLVRGRPTLVAGYGFSGKTLLAQALAIALASQVPVWSRYTPPESANVKHLDYEQGRYATSRRYQRLAVGHGVDLSALVASNRLQVAIFPDVYLDTPNASDIYARALEGTPFAILDALRGATPTIDENDSTIRRCIDNLTRVSEKIGTAFFILHHAGKSRDQQGDDPRKLPRGSSAIFDACGCVLTIEGEKNRPKKVQQTKAPAEAEGRSLEDFYLSIEDVEVGDNPTAGLRVVFQTSDQAQAQTGAQARFQSLKDSILALVAGTPGLVSSNSICQRVAGGSKDSKLAAIRELMDEGKLKQPGGGGTPFVIDPFPRGGETGPGPVSSSLDRSDGSTPLRGGPDGPPPQTGSSKTVTGPPTARKTEQVAADKAAQADKDAEELLTVRKSDWKAYAASKGWSGGRRDDARALAIRKKHLQEKDAQTLVDLPAETDRTAWATEQGWSDDRIKRALAIILREIDS